MNPKLSGVLDLLAILEVAAIILLAAAGLTAVLLLVRAGLPRLAARLDQASFSRSVWRRLLVGILNAVVLFFLGAILTNQGRLKALGLLLFALLIGLALLGLAAEVSKLGSRMRRSSGGSSEQLADTIAGGATVGVSLLLPFVGWAVFLGLVLVSVGTAVSAVFSRRG